MRYGGTDIHWEMLLRLKLTPNCSMTAGLRQRSGAAAGGATEPKENSYVYDTEAFQGCMGGDSLTVTGRGEEPGPSHGALGGLAESHGREAHLPLLTLGEFSADLGGVLKRSNAR